MADEKKRKGFGAWKDKEKLRETARKGGKAAHAAGTAHEFTAEEARRAGALGGKATHAKRGAERRAALEALEAADAANEPERAAS